MDLSSLDSTLPPALADAERDMGDKFRASALNITNMYKSSLGYMKQGYGVGYAACLADVLSTVQSSMSAGQDPTQTLSRLMDWAEAREIAMTALANDDDEPNHTPHMTKVRPSRTTLARQAMAQHTAAATEKEEDPRGRSRHTHIPMASSTPVSTESSVQLDGIATPLSSSPVVGTPALRPTIKSRNSTSHSPSKSFSSSRIEQPTASTSRLPQLSEFAPSIPAPPPLTQSLGLSSSLPPGSKRPLLDVDMTDSTSLPASPITPARGPRSAKRRSMGLGVKEEEERGDRDRDRKRGGRRGHGHGHGHGHGPGHGHGQGTGGQAI